MLHGQDTPDLDRATASGLAYIAAQQLPDGGFYSYSTTRLTDFSAARKYRTTFFPSLILSALSSTPLAGAEAVVAGITGFLLAQRSGDWSFNYWDRGAPEAETMPYPDDLDDTACALAALCKTRPELFDGAVSGKLAGLLIRAETAPGGPYRTWLVDDDAPAAWRDVDVAVNANVADLLALQAVRLPNLTGFVESAIADDKLRSPYYPDHMPLSYFIARWYDGPQTERLVALLLADQHDGHWAQPLHTALAISTLLRLNYPAHELQPAVRYVLASQQADGSWPAAAFCVDPGRRGKPNYGGAATMTTAVCLEALGLYGGQVRAVVTTAKPKPVNHNYARVKAAVNRRIASAPLHLRPPVRRVLRRLLQQDSDKQILLLPWLVADMWPQTVDDALLRQLATANLWGWMAYTIYDDFLDGEGDPQLLPAANFCLRNLVGTLGKALPESTAFQTEVIGIMDVLDSADAWEIAHCRGSFRRGRFHIRSLPDYGDHWQLAERSLGHTIAGLGVLYAAGYATDSAEMKALRDFFRHYLIARQLDDDLHDWEEDLLSGHVNAAAAEVLRLWQARPGTDLRRGIDLSAEMDDLRLLLWQTVVPTLCRQLRRHVREARRALRVLPESGRDNLDRLLDPHDAAAIKAIAARRDTLDFIKTLSA